MVIIEGGLGGTSNDQCETANVQILRSMFEARKQVFVDLLGWDVPVLGGRVEVDQFDNEHATYIVLTDPGGRHLGSARLLPTTRLHILGSLFPELSEGPVPIGPRTQEITRFCLGRDLGASRRLHVRNRLVSALVAHALDRGIRTYTGVAEIGWLQQILAFGWECRPLGPPQRVGSRMLGALEIRIAADTPALLQQNGVWSEEELGPAVLEIAA